MRRTALAAALLVALAACGGDGEPKAAPTRSLAPPSPLALKLRADVTKALAECPCTVTVRLRGKGAKDKSVPLNLKGVYDFRTHATEMNNEDGGAIQLRVVDGRTYIATYETRRLGSPWAELDLSGVPAKAKQATPLTLLALADPTFAMALATSVTGEPRDESVAGAGVARKYAVDFDLATAIPAAGLSAENLRRQVPDAVGTGELTIDAKGIIHVLYRAAGRKGSTSEPFTADVWITSRHIKIDRIAAPAARRVVDAVEGFPAIKR